MRPLYCADTLEAALLFDKTSDRERFLKTVERYNELCDNGQDSDYGSGCRFGFQHTTSLPGQNIRIAQTLGRALGCQIAEM